MPNSSHNAIVCYCLNFTKKKLPKNVTCTENTGQRGGEHNTLGILGCFFKCLIQLLDELEVEGVDGSLVHGDGGQTLVVHHHVHVAATCTRAH